MPRYMAAAIAACLCVPVTAHALTVAFSGTVAMVTDDLDLLDASVAPGAQLSGTYEVDPSDVIGSSPFAVGPARLAFQLGGYSFDASQDPHTISLIDDRIVIPASPPNPAVTVDVWQSGAIVDLDLSPATNPGSPFAGYAAQIEMFDFGSDAFNGGETEPFVPADLIGWNDVRLTLNSIVAGGAIDGRVQVQVQIESWSIVPETHTALLVAFGLVWLAVRGRPRAAALR